MKEGFWKAWKRVQRTLKDEQPECSCGYKHPEKTYHYLGCPYLKYWDGEFTQFLNVWKTRKNTWRMQQRLDSFLEKVEERK